VSQLLDSPEQPFLPGTGVTKTPFSNLGLLSLISLHYLPQQVFLLPGTGGKPDLPSFIFIESLFSAWDCRASIPFFYFQKKAFSSTWDW
jgi:hypothetical protein